ncbi:hypothetical protein SMSP2_00358 [Limihaloglobus sulfuriphilus]|uniref:3-keto-alpha-glucoside-1,2-lyase/3-keto-2-hydroxy-glucal hydratase domain-containing protein n=1 Tax=Limihaloglobus sulfuriphilus TaxID=1851148 RepID=A0A1Q2MBG6_9BACT|nr:family 16 glycoside hydrolase [Limihaloglobus sulfuriphilus]AQQ70021.1 hypothetical protein SMSP2_00358 [Limihaloglobus sulfuriphilus]
MIEIKRFLSVFVLAFSFFAVSSAAAVQVENIIEQMPAPDAKTERMLCQELVEGGPKTVLQLCGLVEAPGEIDDSKARYTIAGLTSYVNRPQAAPAQRKMYASVLLRSLNATDNKEVKAFFISQLQYVGDDGSVVDLARYLGDERLSEDAAMALTAIGTPAAEKALLNALETSPDAAAAPVIQALGKLHSKAAVSLITKHAQSGNELVSRVAARALAEIGDESSIPLIKKRLETGNLYAQSQALADYTLLARRLAQNGNNAGSVQICENIINGEYDPNHKASALSLLVEISGSDSLDYLVDAVQSENYQFQSAALDLAVKLKSKDAGNRWLNLLEQASSQLQVKIIEMLGRRGGKDVLTDLRGFTSAGDKAVRKAALQSVADISPETAAADIVNVIKQGSPDDIEYAFELLLQSPSETAVSRVSAVLGESSNAGKAAFLDFLARRRAYGEKDNIYQYVSSEDEKVCIAAIKALAYVGGENELEKLIDVMLTDDSAQKCSEASRTIIKLSNEIEDADKRAEPLLEAMNDTGDSQKAQILAILPSIGGKAALAAVVSCLDSPDKKLRESAVRSLAKWNGTEAADPLYKVASEAQDLSEHLIAVSAYINLIDRSDMKPSDKLAHYVKAESVTEHTAVRKNILSKVSKVGTVDALRFAVKRLNDSELINEATAAVTSIALPGSEKDKGLIQPGVGKLLLEAYPGISDEKVRHSIDAHVKAIAKAGVSESAGDKSDPPAGFVELFNGKDLTGWKGLLARPYDNPAKRSELNSDEHASHQASADDLMRKHWHVVDGMLYFDGGGHSLATARDYGDFEMLVDWKLLHDNGDSGIYLRGSPQVQIWDPAYHENIGSGGLYNNQKNPSKPLVTADNPIGQWNRFRIKMIGEKVTVHLNGQLVVDNVTLENYWDRSRPIFESEQIELQCHGNPVCFKNIYIRELPREDEFVPLFNGRDLAGWTGDTQGYAVENGNIICKPGGVLYTEKQYSDFVLKFEFKLTPGANNGLGIRTPMNVNAAYHGMELQIIDNFAEKYNNLKPWQYHGSIYGVAAADYNGEPTKTSILNQPGEWNRQIVTADGDNIKVVLNGETIVDADLGKIDLEKTADGREHPGLNNKSGHIAFLGHGSVVEFRDILIKELNIKGHNMTEDKDSKKQRAVEAAINGLDFLVRHQITNHRSADHGRFVNVYDTLKNEAVSYTTNWTTGVSTEVMLIGHKLTGDQKYLDAAERAVKYIASLQYLAPGRMRGVIRESTPQTQAAHPRDALTAAWAMLDYSQYASDEKYLEKSLLYADWFINVGLEKGYPYWTVRLDDEPWLPQWFGSFQSGGAFYFFRLFDVTGREEYKQAGLQIMDFYNKYHLSETGDVTIVVDIETRKQLKGHIEAPQYSPLGWEVMHEYNDDFGALANLAAYRQTRNQDYLNNAERFLKKMISSQREDGGFGPKDYSVPSAGGSVLLELMAARELGLTVGSSDNLDRALDYILDLQITDPQSPARGAFRGFDHNYQISGFANTRTATYAIMGLLRYAGAADPFYFFDSENMKE